MRARLGRCMILDARFVNHTPKPSLTVSWRIVGNSYLIGIMEGLPVTLAQYQEASMIHSNDQLRWLLELFALELWD